MAETGTKIVKQTEKQTLGKRAGRTSLEENADGDRCRNKVCSSSCPTCTMGEIVPAWGLGLASKCMTHDDIDAPTCSRGHHTLCLGEVPLPGPSSPSPDSPVPEGQVGSAKWSEAGAAVRGHRTTWRARGSGEERGFVN